jgi:hypothetical protein
MAATVTVTGVTGPGTALSARVFSNVLSFRVDAVLNILFLTIDGQLNETAITVVAATTVTATKSGSTWTLVIS